MSYYDLAKDFLDKNKGKKITPQKLADFLQDNEWCIYNHYDTQNKRCEIRTELEERGIEFDDVDIDNILDYYEDFLSEDDAWIDCLNRAITNAMTRF